MSEVWSTVIVASVSIVGIVVAQILTSRATRGQMVLQSRFSFLEEGYKDNIVVWHALADVEKGKELDDNIEKMQEIVDKRPYNLAIKFLLKWVDCKDALNNIDIKKRRQAVIELYDASKSNLRFYAKRYYEQVLGLEGEELADFLKSLRPDFSKPIID